MSDDSLSKKTKPSMFQEYPAPLDEEDPEVQEEIFETLRAMRTLPEQLPDPLERRDYAAWLKIHSQDETD
jgi:hypothetical protein